MNKYYKYDLYSHNTMRIHCIADEVIVPETKEELIDLIKSYKADYIFIAAGSNIILPAKIKRTIVLLTSLPSEIKIEGTCVTASASVRIQKLIRTMQQIGLGGIEYLFSVPCTLGGAVYMNAGRGEIFNQSISDYIKSVECFDKETGEIVDLLKSDCNFIYRHSVFFEGRYIILSVCLEMKSMTPNEVEENIRQRIERAKEYLDADKPSSGSIFRVCNPMIIRWLKGVRIGGACWSKKTENWISNDRNASNNDIINLIRLAQVLHKLFRKPCTREVIIYK